MNTNTLGLRKKVALITGITIAMGGLSLPTYADSHHDYQQIYKALNSGELQPLQATLDKALEKYPGQPTQIELDRDDGEYEYEIKILRDNGTAVELEIDAKTGEIISVKKRKR